MNRLIEWLASTCKQHLLEEKWLLADDLRIAQQWKDRLNLAGHTSIHLHSKTLRSLAISLVGEQLDTTGIVFANQATTGMLVHSLLSEMLEKGELKYFASIQSLDGVCELFSRSIRDLRLTGVFPDALFAADFESATKARDVKRVYDAYCTRLQNERLADYADCLRIAIDGLRNNKIALPACLFVLIPEEWTLCQTESDLLAAIADKATVIRPPVEAFSEATAKRRIADRMSAGEVTFQYLSGLGEVNEMRAVLQRIISANDGSLNALDQVEILTTDNSQYAPLLLELLSGCFAANPDPDAATPTIDSLPVTFAEGISCVYSRPGRALRSWLRWVRTDFVQTKAVQLFREGLLTRPSNAADVGYSRLANTLRSIPIAFQAERYLAKLGEAIQSAKKCIEEYTARGDREEELDLKKEPFIRDFGLPTLKAVFAMMKPLIELAPHSGEGAANVLVKARKFLWNCARAENKLDRYAREKLLDDINGMLLTLQATPDSQLDVLQWLEDLPLESFVLANGPMPGCVHISTLAHGGYSGRKQLFVAGLDDDRFPKRSMVDPILLDAERKRISPQLKTALQNSKEQQLALDRVLFRVLGDPNVCVTLSYSVRKFSDDRECFPSTAMLEMYRISHGKPSANMDDLKSAIGLPVSFVSHSTDDHLVCTDFLISDLLEESDEQERRRSLEAQFDLMRRNRIAREFGEAHQVNAYDGFVPLAGSELDPSAGGSVSSSRLEDYGACPRRYFFKRGLNVHLPEEWSVDMERWLDPFMFGNLVHELFEEFLRGLTANDQTPSLARDREAMQAILHVKIDRLQLDVPAPCTDAFLRQCNELEEICEIFLSKEEDYCREYNAKPWILESAIGLSVESKTILDCIDPVELSLSDGRVLRVNGRIDRVDKFQLNGSERYVIWDYKSGSKFGFSQEQPFGQGRKLQPFLYLGMLRHRIAATGGNPESVDSFGYFFPNPKEEGLRLRWTRGELRPGDEILRNICDAIASGVFVATTNEDDCTFCDYRAVCSDTNFVTMNSMRKAIHPLNVVLEPFRKLRAIEVDRERQQS